MKCIRCEADSKYQERTGRKCPRCGGRFAFEPKDGDPFTDPAFKRAIEVVSAEGRVRWGVEHLYYELSQRNRQLAMLPAILWTIGGVVGAGAIGLGVIGGLVGIAGGSLVCVGMGVVIALAGLVPAALLLWGGFRANESMGLVRLDREKFRDLYDRWVDIHGSPAGVIVRKRQQARKPAESDIGDYSFDRAVICDRARTVDLLLANNFHFENNCAVLSIEGYPQGPFETVRAMLKRNPRLQVFVLHDATPEGCSMAHRLATDPAWFAGQVKVIDVGLRPSQAPAFRGLLIPAQAKEVAAGEAITVWEANWLSKYALEIAAVRPEQVLKRLFRAINTPIDASKYAGPVIYLAAREPLSSPSPSDGDGGSSGLFASDADDFDGPADAFG